MPAAKKLKLGPTINTPPVERLDVYVFGGGENNELGLGAKKIDGKSPSDVKRPRYNPFLKGVTQIAVGGMHCVALTDDQKILTWGVSDGGPLGRDTSSYEAPAKDIDADSDSEDEDDITLNPVESTPTAINTEFLEGRKVVQVLASDSASFVLTEDGYVYGWGSFVVSQLPNLPCMSANNNREMMVSLVSRLMVQPRRPRRKTEMPRRSFRFRRSP